MTPPVLRNGITFFLLKKRIEKKKMNDFFFVRKIVFLFEKKISQNVFWINCGSQEHKKKFLEAERGRER
jgi:hypothetical protein